MAEGWRFTKALTCVACEDFRAGGARWVLVESVIPTQAEQ